MKKQHWIMLALVLLLGLSIVFGVYMGYTQLSLGDIFRILTGGGTDTENLIVQKLRLPRVYLAIISGAGFALAGCVMQTVVKNPLADPSIMGINAGAGLFVVLYLTLAGTLSLFNFFSLPLLAILGALLTAGLIFALSSSGYQMRTSRLVLNGIAVQLGMNGIMTILVLYLDNTQYNFLVRFQAGSFYNATMNLVYPSAIGVSLCFLYILLKTRTLNLMVLGNDMATGLGVHVKRERTKLIFASVITAAICVSTSGSLNFVGLVSPHIARKLVGNKHQYLLMASALIGSSLVLIADAIGRTILQPITIPVGLVTSMVGAPFFLFLLMKGRRPG